MKLSIRNVALWGMLVVMTSACTAKGPGVTTPPPMTAAEIAQQQARQSLDDALALYASGEYRPAENKLLATEVWQGDQQTQVAALKHLAFIYCISERMQMCRHAFERAMHIDPSFTLSTAEATHPLWGPEYEQAHTGKQN